MNISGKILARNTLLNFTGHAITLITGIITIPIIIQGMGTERFGLLSLIWIALGYFTIFDLGLGRATTKYVAEAVGKNEYNKVAELTWTTTTIQVIFGIIGTLLVIGSATVIIEHLLKITPSLMIEARSAFYILACSVPIILISSSFSGLLAAIQRFDLINAVRIPSSVLTFIIPMLGGILGWSLPVIIILLVILKTIVFVAFFLISLSLIPSLRKFVSFRKYLVKKLFVFGSWITVSNILGPIIRYLDRFMIGAIISASAIAYYTTPFDIMQRLWIIPSSFVLTLFPAFSTLIGQGNHDRIHNLFFRSLKFLFAITIPIFLFLIVFAKQILYQWLGVDFVQNSLLPFQILALSSMIGIAAPVADAILQGYGRPDIVAKIYLVNTPLNILFVWYMTSTFALPGAAISAVIRTTIETVILMIFTLRTIKISLNIAVRTYLPVMIVTFLAGVFALACLFFGNIYHKIIIFSSMLVMYIFGFWRFVFTAQDRYFILNILKSCPQYIMQKISGNV